MLRKYYELGGKLYEAVTACGLEDLNVKYVWNPPLLLMRIVPDFVIPKEEDPRKVILVTHSMSHGTKMKFLRNIDELFEIKTRISPQCVALNLVYSSKEGWKAQLLDIFGNAFDGNLIVFRKEYGTDFLNILHGHLLKEIEDLSFEEAKAKVREAIESSSELKEVYENRFLQDLDKLLKSSLNKDLLSLWEKEHNRVASMRESNQTMSIRDTFFKRGLLMTMFLTADELEHLCNWARAKKTPLLVMDGKLKKFLGHLKDLGLISLKKTLLREEVLLDKMLFFILTRMSQEEIRTFHEFVLSCHPNLEDYTFKLRDTNKLREMIVYFCEEWRRRTNTPTKNLIREMLRDCNKHSKRLKIFSSRNWVLEIIMDIVRYFKPEMRYSYGVLSRESGFSMTGGFSPIPLFTRGEKELADDELERASIALGNHIDSIGVGRIEKDIAGIVQESCQHTLITLAQHRTINILRLLILRELQKSGCEEIEEGVRIRSCLAAYSNVSVGTADSTYTFKTKKGNATLIVEAIAAYAQTHKHKEMSARVRMSRYEWKEDIRSFSERKGIDKWILVIDGPWNDLSGGKTKFFEMLLEAGWDHITYPDQLSRIIAQISEKK